MDYIHIIMLSLGAGLGFFANSVISHNALSKMQERLSALQQEKEKVDYALYQANMTVKTNWDVSPFNPNGRFYDKEMLDRYTQRFNAINGTN